MTEIIFRRRRAKNATARELKMMLANLSLCRDVVLLPMIFARLFRYQALKQQFCLESTSCMLQRTTVLGQGILHYIQMNKFLFAFKFLRYRLCYW